MSSRNSKRDDRPRERRVLDEYFRDPRERDVRPEVITSRHDRAPPSVHPNASAYTHPMESEGPSLYGYTSSYTGLSPPLYKTTRDELREAQDELHEAGVQIREAEQRRDDAKSEKRKLERKLETANRRSEASEKRLQAALEQITSLEEQLHADEVERSVHLLARIRRRFLDGWLDTLINIAIIASITLVCSSPPYILLLHTLSLIVAVSLYLLGAELAPGAEPQRNTNSDTGVEGQSLSRTLQGRAVDEKDRITRIREENLAEEKRFVSDAMRIIAILSLAFLPASAFAAVFSEASPYASGSLRNIVRIYWATAAPLTAITAALIWLWHRSETKSRGQNRDASTTRQSKDQDEGQGASAGTSSQPQPASVETDESDEFYETKDDSPLPQPSNPSHDPKRDVIEYESKKERRKAKDRARRKADKEESRHKPRSRRYSIDKADRWDRDRFERFETREREFEPPSDEKISRVPYEIYRDVEEKRDDYRSTSQRMATPGAYEHQRSMSNPPSQRYGRLGPYDTKHMDSLSKQGVREAVIRHDDGFEIIDPDDVSVRETSEAAAAEQPIDASNLELEAVPDPAPGSEALAKALKAASSVFGSSKSVESLLETDFDKVAQGEYAWLRELVQLGYGRQQIAELLLADRNDSPWIFFSPAPETKTNLEISAQRHIRGCAHRLPWSPSGMTQDVSSVADPSDFDNVADIYIQIQRLCGLGGVFPSVQDRERCKRSADFEEDSSVAFITYHFHSWNFYDLDHRSSDVRTICTHAAQTFDRLRTAFGRAQAAGLCCQSFTLLRRTLDTTGEEPQKDEVIELCRINFGVILRIYDEFRQFIKDPMQEDADAPAAKTLLDYLFPGEGNSRCFSCPNKPSALQVYCLIIQILSVGFLSYIQAHVGVLHPSFLDTPLRKIRLLGCQQNIRSSNDLSRSRDKHIEFDLLNLTCVGDMLKGPVLTLSSLDDRISEWADPPARFDLVASCEDLIDTWGPGNFILPREGDQLPSAVSICGGVIHGSDPASSKYHWSEMPGDGSAANVFTGQIVPDAKIRIGSPITVNEQCTLDEDHCRSIWTGSLRPLGTHPPGWTFAERQIGVQAGQYVLVQANAGYHRFPGRTLKQYQLEQKDEQLVPFLNDHWAVQVSLCTGLARRVSLREMVADLLPIFANDLTRQEDWKNWECLKDHHSILDSIRRGNLKDWLRSLPQPLHDLILQIIGRILHSLRDTGLDKEGESLLVAWPGMDDTYRCFAIDLKQHETSWARLIADSEDCATFAYISPKCLQTKEVRCQGTDGSWRNAIPLLETSVMTCSGSPSSPMPGPSAKGLRHKETYYFKKFDHDFFVEVQKPDGAAVAKLVQKPSQIPIRIRQRLFARTQLLASVSEPNVLRLRERKGIVEYGGHAAVLTSFRK